MFVPPSMRRARERSMKKKRICTPAFRPDCFAERMPHPYSSVRGGSRQRALPVRRAHTFQPLGQPHEDYVFMVRWDCVTYTHLADMTDSKREQRGELSVKTLGENSRRKLSEKTLGEAGRCGRRTCGTARLKQWLAEVDMGRVKQHQFDTSNETACG
jgi:hypothetical protein